MSTPTPWYMIDSLPVDAFGTSGSSTVNLLDLLQEAYGDQVSSIASIQIAYRDQSWLNSPVSNPPPDNAPFSDWDPGVPGAHHYREHSSERD